MDEPPAAQLGSDDEESDNEALEDCGDNALDNNSKVTKSGSEVIYDLSHKRFSEVMRPQHALLYANIQGRTLKGCMCLMEVTNDRVSVRDLITAASRPTMMEHLKVMTFQQQQTFMDMIRRMKANGDFNMPVRAQQIIARKAIPSERPTPSRVGR